MHAAAEELPIIRRLISLGKQRHALDILFGGFSLERRGLSRVLWTAGCDSNVEQYHTNILLQLFYKFQICRH